MAKNLTATAIALRNLQNRRKHYLTLTIGIILAMIFSSGVPFFYSCMRASQQELINRELGKQNHIVFNTQDYDWEKLESQGYFQGEVGFAYIQRFAWTGEEVEKGAAIGWLDSRAMELYYPQIQQGRWPQEPGEIAVEANALARMQLEPELNSTITLNSVVSNGEGYGENQQEVSYRLVGILGDKRQNLEYQARNVQIAVPLGSGGEEVKTHTAQLPAAFVCAQEPIPAGGKEIAAAYFNLNPEKEEEFIFLPSFVWEKSIRIFPISSSLGESGDIQNSSLLLAALATMLALLSCFGIANVFSSNLKERRQQIGMYRALGATRWQILDIFGREALLICLVCTPVSVALSYFGVKFFAWCMGENFVFLPNLLLLAAGAGVGILSVLISALVPLVGAARVSPMQAIRSAQWMRQMRQHRVRSQTEFDLPRLLAKRRGMFDRWRQISVCIILGLTVFASCLGVGYLVGSYRNIGTTLQPFDYEIRLSSFSGNGNNFVNTLGLNDLISQQEAQKCLELPYVKNIYGEKECYVNLLIDGEVPDYLLLHEFFNIRSESRYSFNVPSLQGQMNADNFWDLIQSKENPTYLEVKEAAGYTQEAINTQLVARSGRLITSLEDQVIAGKIDLDKLDSGEEIIVCAPEKIGFFWEFDSDGSGSCGMLDLSKEEEKYSRVEKGDLKKVMVTADSCFQVGQELTLSLLVDDGSGKLTREDRTVKIGAIVRTGEAFWGNSFAVYTTVAGLGCFTQPFDFKNLHVELEQGTAEQIDAQMVRALEALFPGYNIRSYYSQVQQQKESFATSLIATGSLIAVFSAISISLISNGITAQIREGKRSIGTLRAVGATEQDIVRCYALQIAKMILWGTVLGLLGCGFEYLFPYFTGGKVTLWPGLVLPVVIFLVCMVNLRLRVRQVIRQSIVENIREL